MSSPLLLGKYLRSQHAHTLPPITGDYPVPIGTRRSWAKQTREILEARRSAPCPIRLGPVSINRHPPA